MRPTWRDGVATGLVGLAVAAAMAATRGSDLPMLGSYRAATGVLAVVGLSACIVGGSSIGSSTSFKDPFLIVASSLGGVASVLVMVGLATGARAAMVTLAMVIVALWAVATLRHAIGSAPRTVARYRPRGGDPRWT